MPKPVVSPGAHPRDEKARKAGKALFKSIGCAECHVEKLGDVEGLYSDLLLHAMSPELGDTPSYGAFLSGAAAQPVHPAGEVRIGADSAGIRRSQTSTVRSECRGAPTAGAAAVVSAYAPSAGL